MNINVERTCETTSTTSTTSDYRKLFTFRLVPVFYSLTRSSWRYYVFYQRDSDIERVIITNRKWFHYSLNWQYSFVLVVLVIGFSKETGVLFNFQSNYVKIIMGQFALQRLIIVNLLEESEVAYEFWLLLMKRWWKRRRMLLMCVTWDSWLMSILFGVSLI